MKSSTIWKYTHRQFGQTELDMVGCDQQIASQSHFKSTADGMAVDGGDDWFVEAPVLGESGKTTFAVIIAFPPVV